MPMFGRLKIIKIQLSGNDRYAVARSTTFGNDTLLSPAFKKKSEAMKFREKKRRQLKKLGF